MNLVVLGLWHLGSVTAACCAKHFTVIGLDFDVETIRGLNSGKAPIFEPQLNETIQSGLHNGSLSFTTNAAAACGGAEVLWLCRDTPVDNDDRSDVESVLSELRQALPHLPRGAKVVVSSQLPVGTCRKLETEFPQFTFACIPENLRLGKALHCFENSERVVVGMRPDSDPAWLERLLRPFATQILFMRTESAEMVKHALNSFLALSVTFINEIAALSEHVGADAREVATGLKTDARIGPKAYLNPGGPYAGGTLARDVVALTQLGAAVGEKLAVIPAVQQSNDHHRGWAFRRLQSRFKQLEGKVIAVLGLTYKADTDTLRRSPAVELMMSVLQAGAIVNAFDPVVKALPPALGAVRLASTVGEAVAGADAAVICTEWPALRSADWSALLATTRTGLVVDANGFLENQVKPIKGIEFLSVGRA